MEYVIIKDGQVAAGPSSVNGLPSVSMQRKAREIGGTIVNALYDKPEISSPFKTYGDVEIDVGEELVVYRYTIVYKPLAECKAIKLREVLSGSDAALDELSYKYSQNEKLSWPKQETEAKALEANPDAPAPLLRGIASERGISVEELKNKVLANVAASEQTTSYILGKQQGYEDAIKAATTFEDLDFEIDYSFSG